MMDRVDGYVTSTYICSVCPQGRTIGTKEGRKAKQVSNEERERRMKEERQDSLVDGVPTPRFYVWRGGRSFAWTGACGSLVECVSYRARVSCTACI